MALFLCEMIKEFTLEDFRDQLMQVARRRPLQRIAGLIPGMSQLNDMWDDADVETDVKRLSGIIDSMTATERRNPITTIDQSRRRRIAAGSGVQPQDVRELVSQFKAISQIMRRMGGDEGGARRIRE